jgi:adenosine kinase
MNIYVSGSLAYDRIMTFPGRFSDHILPDKLHILNVCFLVDNLEEKFGGTAGNIAYSLSLLGEKPLIMAAVGRDFDRYGRRLARLGLPLDGVRRVEEELTAGAYITTDAKDNQITGFNPGAMKRRAGFEITDGHAAGALGIVSPGNVEDMVGYAAAFRERNIPYIFDPGQQIPALSREAMLDAVHGAMALVTNDYELEMVCRTLDTDWRGLLEHAGAVVTTLGAEGSVIRDATGETRAPAYAVQEAKDPTGAGDAYRAGLLKGLSQGESLVRAAAMGAVCASFCVERHGTQEHAFTEEEFRARLDDLGGA